MNETIGVKGDRNDQKRCLLISKKIKEKLQAYHQEQTRKELIELEKKVKLQQTLTFFKTLPIVVAGQIITTLTEDNKRKKDFAINEAIEQLEKENIFNERETREIITALRNGNLFSLDNEVLEKMGIDTIQGFYFERPMEADVISREFPGRKTRE